MKATEEDEAEIDKLHKKHLLYQRLQEYGKWLLVMAIAVVPFSLWTGSMGQSTDWLLLQRFYAIRGERTHYQGMIIVGMDSALVGENGRIPRATIAEGLERIVAAKPKLLIFDASLSKNDTDLEANQRIANAFASVPSVIGAGKFYTGRSADDFVVFGSDPIFSAAAKFEIPMIFFGAEGVVTRIGIDPSPSATLVERLPLAQAIPTEVLDPSITPPAYNDLINFYGPPGTIRSVTLQEVRDGDAEFAREHFHDQIVFVGFHSIRLNNIEKKNSDEFDIYAYNIYMYGVEVHATIVANLIDQSWLRQWKLQVNELLVYILSVLLLRLAFSFISWQAYLLITFPLLTALTIANYILFSWYNLWVGGVAMLWIVAGLSILAATVYTKLSLRRVNKYLDKELGNRLEIENRVAPVSGENLAYLKPQTVLLERYTVRSLLGEGGMGCAYLCFDQLQNREVVLKVPHTNRIKDEQERARFLREFSLLSKLNHKNIVKVFELHETEKFPFFTMEYLQGTPLDAFIASLTPETLRSKEFAAQALKILEELANALHAVHSLDVIHHDLKPSNIFLVPSAAEAGSNQLQVKLLDFGVALDKNSHTSEEAQIGSLFYRSPEQYRGELLNTTADVHVFGLIAYELLSGSPPFAKKEEEIDRVKGGSIARKIRVGEIPDIPTIHPKVRQMVNWTVRICLKRDSRLRYKSMKTIQERMRSALEVLETPSWLEKIRRLC